MSQHDYVIANQAGSLFRSDLNSVLAAIYSSNSGASEPSSMFAYMFWADTTNGVMKQRNAANTAWITLFRLADGSGYTHPVRSLSATGSMTMFENGITLRVTGSATFGLPNVASLANGFHFGYKVEGGTLTIDPASTQQINGASTLALVAGEEGFVYNDGSAWRVLRATTNVESVHTINVTSGATTRNLTVSNVASIANLSASSITSLRYHGVVDTWVKFTGSSSAIISSDNVSTVSKTAVGQWTVFFTTALIDDGYLPIGPISTDTGASVSGGSSPKIVTQTSSYCSFTIGRSDTGAYVDPSVVWIGFAGTKS